jgi:hypothetical protein
MMDPALTKKDVRFVAVHPVYSHRLQNCGRQDFLIAFSGTDVAMTALNVLR